MSHAPRFYIMGARSRRSRPAPWMARRTYLATDGCGVETIDFVTRQRRPSCKEDVAAMARVSDYLTSIGFYWPIVSAQDLPSTAPLHELDAAYNNTVKHVQSETIMGAAMARYAVEMARVIAGDEAGMRRRPPLSLLVCCIAPLGLDRDGIESALTLAAAGLPVGFMSMANLGSTGPATPAGTLVVGDAEIVAALTLIQMAHPGAPVFHSMMPGIMHPRTGAYLATAWEGTLLYPVGVEMAHQWGVPSLAGVFATDAPVPGWQSAGRCCLFAHAVRAGRCRDRQRAGPARIVPAALSGGHPARQRHLSPRPHRSRRPGYRPGSAGAGRDPRGGPTRPLSQAAPHARPPAATPFLRSQQPAGARRRYARSDRSRPGEGALDPGEPPSRAP